MFPLHPLVLLYVKMFVVVTCACFWARVILRIFIRSQLPRGTWYSDR